MTNNQEKNKLIQTDPAGQMTELANKDIKTVIITIAKDVKVNMNTVREMVRWK